MDNEFKIIFSAVTDKLKKAMKGASDSVKEFSDDVTKTGKDLKDTASKFDLFKEGGVIFEKLDNITGGFGSEVLALGKKLSQSFKLGVAGARALKIAIASTGIGLLVIALGLIVAYWKDIKGFVTGVSGELVRQKELLEEQVEDQEYTLKLLNSSDNTLKLQGKSQLQINNLKIKELEALLLIKKQLLENQKTSLENAKEQEKIYKDLAGKLIDFAIAPFLALTKLLSKLRPEFAGVQAIVENFAKKGKDALLGLIDDKLTKDIEENVDKINLELVQLQNTIDGLKLANKELVPRTPIGVNDIIAPNLVQDIQKVGGEMSTALEGIYGGEFLTQAKIKVREEEAEIMQSLREFNAQANQIIQNETANIFIGLGQLIGDALSGGGDILNKAGGLLLGSMGAILTQLGQMAIKTGVGILAVKKSLESLNPYLAIAGGIGLVALGSMFSKGAKNIGSSMGSGGASVSAGGTGGQVGGVRSFGGSSSVGGGKVVFEIAGTKLVGVLSNTLNENTALGGNISVN